MAKPKLTDADWQRIWDEKFAIEPERRDITLQSSLGKPIRNRKVIFEKDQDPYTYLGPNLMRKAKVVYDICRKNKTYY